MDWKVFRMKSFAISKLLLLKQMSLDDDDDDHKIGAHIDLLISNTNKTSILGMSIGLTDSLSAEEVKSKPIKYHHGCHKEHLYIIKTNSNL